MGKPDKVLIAERIKALREKNGMTQVELARALGLTRASVNAWEMGAALPSITYVVGICDLFHVRSDYLLGLEREEKGESILIEAFSPKEQELFYRLANCLSDLKAAARLGTATIAANKTNQ